MLNEHLFDTLAAQDEQAESLQTFRCVYACLSSIDASLWLLAIASNSPCKGEVFFAFQSEA